MEDREKLIKGYSEEYCGFLEATYSKDMLSEGETVAVERLFLNIPLEGKKFLDVGFGLGGIATYLAKKYNAHVSGIEINPWLTQEANRRVPDSLKNQIDFRLYDDASNLPFSDNSFDIIYSKGVLTHVKNKLLLFTELRRVLKKDGVLVIDDWLSPNQSKWGAKITFLMKLENLILYAETESNYINLLRQAGFSDITVRDESEKYLGYNQTIIDRLQEPDMVHQLNQKFGPTSAEEAIKGYSVIVQALEEHELLIRNFKARTIPN